MWEPKTTTEWDLVDYDKVDPKLLEMQAELYKQIVLQSLIGRAEDGMAEYWDLVRDRMTVHGKGDNNTSVFLDEPKTAQMPQKVCNYRKSRVEWYGTATKAYSLGTGYQPLHFEVLGDTVETFKGKRFIAVSEYETDKMDSDFLMKLTGGTMTTRTLNKGEPWKPQGEIIFMSGSKPPRINEKDKDTLDKVQGIVFHPAE